MRLNLPPIQDCKTLLANLLFPYQWGLDSNGMPLGVQFAAPYGEDKRLLELAYELEEAKGWPSIVN